MESDDPAVRALETIMQAIELGQGITRNLIEANRANGDRIAELAEDVADIGRRVAQLESGNAAGHSLGVTRLTTTPALMDLARVLREELASEVAELTQRIDTVHERALRALTDLTERNKPA